MSRLLAPSLTSCSRTQVHLWGHGAAGGAQGCSAPSHQAWPSPGVGGCCHTAPLPQDTGHVGALEAMEETLIPVPQPPPPAAGLGAKAVHPTSQGHTAAARRAQLLFQSPLLSSGIWEKGHRLPSASPWSRTGPGSDQKSCGPDSEPGQGCCPAGVWHPWRRGGDGRGSLTPDMPPMVPWAAPLSPALHPAVHVVPPRPPSPDPDRIVTAAWGGRGWQLLGPSPRAARMEPDSRESSRRERLLPQTLFPPRGSGRIPLGICAGPGQAAGRHTGTSRLQLSSELGCIRRRPAPKDVPGAPASLCEWVGALSSALQGSPEVQPWASLVSLISILPHTPSHP